MNTPTPAQALGEALRLISSNPEGVHKIHAEQVALRMIEQHGQHFAGLEARLNDVQNAWCVQATELRERAEAAEARCAELEGGCQMLREEVEGLRAAFLAARGERHE